MEAEISSFCKALSGVCTSVESASASLSDNVSRPPIPLESAVSMFLNSMDKHVSTVNGDLEQLESMVLGTVSFEELLGHCNEVLKVNQKYISDIQDHMSQFGYVPEIDVQASNDGMNFMDCKLESPKQLERSHLKCGSVSVARSKRRLLHDDALFEESLSLKNLGLSDACLATLSSQGASFLDSPKESSERFLSFHDEQPCGVETKPHYEIDGSLNNGISKDSEIHPKAAEINVSKDAYDNLPAYIRNLATWEELIAVVEKLNPFFSNGRESAIFSQDDSEKLGLGRKGRSCLLMLLRLNQLVMENIDGSNFYRLNIVNS
ncbi:Methyl-CpG-binding domain protein 4 [Rhynchospora pubera]|uniref:Methyl-CpG-binding domain protein 4 n=1 Tax=Rhynchospora pubera TaxID=906938 RepID=A0AAV8FA46_9POAL|nr:Methyl-CpG-binding domain protein 4 [Rhynchospora pubera]